MSLEINQYLILNNKSYFAVAEEFVNAQQLFKQETLFEKLNFWIDMVLYPLYNLCSILFLDAGFGLFTILSIHKTVTKWYEYFKFWLLKQETQEWRKIVKSVGGPFISTNDDMYHAYVYADGMQRLHNELFRKKRIY